MVLGNESTFILWLFGMAILFGVIVAIGVFVLIRRDRKKD